MTTVLALSTVFIAQTDARSSGKVANESTCKSCVSQAASLFASNQLEDAAKLLRQNSAACPKNSQLHLLLSTILIRLGKNSMAEAENEASLACLAQPDSQAAHLQYANTLLLQEKYAQACTEFESVTNLNPASYESWSALGDLYKRLHRDEEAKSAVEKASVLEPATQAIRLSVVQNLKKQGRISQARKELKKLMQAADGVPEVLQSLASEAIAIGAFDDAINASETVIKAYPNSIGPMNCLLIAQFMKHQYKSAEATADKILEKEKNSDALALRGLSKLYIGKSSEALSDIESASKINATSGFVMFANGILKVQKGDFEAATETLDGATGADTRGAQADKIPQALAHLALAQIHRKEGLLTESINEARAAGADKRFQSAALGIEARALLLDQSRADALTAAIKCASDSISADADEPNANLAQAFCDLKAGNFESARKFTNKASSAAPNDSELKLAQAKLASHDGNTSLEKQELEAGLKTAENDPELLYELGSLFLRENKAAEALPILKQAVDKRVRGPELCFALAEACEKTGDSASSLKYYKQSLSQGLSGDNSKQAKDAITRLESAK